MRYSHSREGGIELMVEKTTDALPMAELGKHVKSFERPRPPGSNAGDF